MSIDRVIVVMSLVGLVACEADFASSMPGGGGPGSNFGATPGGQQDIGKARVDIESGLVPQPDTVMVEGLLSEHDLPSSAESCDSVLCLQPDLGVAPDMMRGEQAYWVQIGMMSGLSRDTWRRPPLDVVVAIDKSGSMSIDMAETNRAVINMLDHLTERDRIAIVAFDDDARTLVPLGPPTDKAGIAATVRAIEADGGFDMIEGAELAFQIARSAARDPRRMRRVMFFACGTPGVGNEQDDRFSELVKGAAREDIGTSFFGVLVGFSNPLSKMLGDTRGGSAYYLQDLARVELVFDDDFEQMVTPLAYDLSIGIEAAGNYVVDEVYGLPGSDASSNHVATAFMSNHKGAIIARLRPANNDATRPENLGHVSFTYDANTALGLSAPTETVFSLDLPSNLGAEAVHFGGPGVRKAVALVNMAEMMRAAMTAFHVGERTEALAIASRLVDYLEGEAAALDDAGLLAELPLVRQLKATIAQAQ